jgi:hypothetical protein
VLEIPFTAAAAFAACGFAPSITRVFLFLAITDAPEIEVERSFIHTGVGYEAQLICIVHAEPQPNVIWYKDTTQLGTTEQHSQQVS